jgi:hypothetical protein
MKNIRLRWEVCTDVSNDYRQSGIIKLECSLRIGGEHPHPMYSTSEYFSMIGRSQIGAAVEMACRNMAKDIENAVNAIEEGDHATAHNAAQG